jgi:hypothetical protein
VDPASAAVAAGIPVIGSDAAYLGDTGAVYVDLDPRAVGRLQGRMAGVHAKSLTAETAAFAAILNDTGAEGRDPVADAAERMASLTNPNVVVVGRFKSSPRSAKAAVTTALRQFRGLKILLGANAARAVTDLPSIKKPRVPRALVAFGLVCTPAMKDAILAGSRLKGCVDVDRAAAGGLVVDALARLLTGGTLPGLIEVPIAPFPLEAADTPDQAVPG